MLGRRPLVAALTAVTIAGCGPGTEGFGVLRRDSLGVTIVESTRPAWDSTDSWLVDPEPVMDLTTTGQGSAHEFFRVQDATRLPNGTYAVADRGANEIRLFTPLGVFIRAAGGPGEGPGEFDRLTSVAFHRGDSLLAYDHWLRRGTIFELAGRGVRTFSPYAPEVRLWRVYPLNDDLLIGAIDDFSPTHETGMYREDFTIVRIRWSGQVLDTIATLPGSESFLFDRGSANPLFARTGHVAVRGGRIYLGSADSLEYAIYASDGQLNQIVRVPGFDLRLSEAEIEAERIARTALQPPNLPRWYWEVEEGLPAPKTRPAYSSLRVDEAGAVWGSVTKFV